MSSNGPTTGHIRTYIVDDHPAIRYALREAIETATGMGVSGEAGSREVAFREIEELRPDVIIVDISLGDGSGLDLIENVKAQHPDVEAVVVSMYDENVYAERAIRAGATGYLMKSEPTERVVEAIRTAQEGELFLSGEMSSRILNKVALGQTSETSSPLDELTAREMSVFQMLGQGYSIEEIVDRLDLARKTVETYRRRAKEKLGFDSVPELLQYAVQWTYEQGTHADEDYIVG